LAKAIRDDCRHLAELEGDSLKVFMRQTRGEPDPPEELAVQARIAEQAATISCPPCYGFNEFWDDGGRLASLKEVKDADAEKAQVIARMEAFKQSPEGRGRARIRSLTSIDRPSSEEESELDRLLTLYPEPWCDPNDPMRDQCAAWRAASIKYRRE
jgi:hypothetical protein